MALFGWWKASALTDLHHGRVALLAGKADIALARFRRAAERAPDSLHYSALPQSPLTYVGRAFYELKQFAEARHALEGAILRFDEDKMARLYFGMTLMRLGDHNNGAREIETGLVGIEQWLDYIQGKTRQGVFWDPAGEIRAAIDEALGMISAKSSDWQRLVAATEWIGNRLEREIDLVRRDEQNESSGE